METLILEDRLFDMISGNSGIVLVLINMYRKTKKPIYLHGSLTVGYQKKVPAGRIKPAFFVSNFWFLSIVFYCNVL